MSLVLLINAVKILYKTGFLINNL